MAQYSTGTVVTAAGTNTISGTSTGWIKGSNVSVGDEITIGPDSVFYIVSDVDNVTQAITLTTNYPTTRIDVSYAVVTDFTTNHDLPKVNQGDRHFPDIYTRAMTLIDALEGLVLVDAAGTPGYLEDKLVAGDGIDITQPSGEDTLTVSASSQTREMFLTAGGAMTVNCSKETIESAAGPILRVVRMDDTDGSNTPEAQWTFTVPIDYAGGLVEVVLFLTMENTAFVSGDIWRFDVESAHWNNAIINPLEQGVTVIADQDVTTPDPTATGELADILTASLGSKDLVWTAGRMVNFTLIFDVLNSDYTYVDVIGVLLKFSTQDT